MAMRNSLYATTLIVLAACGGGGGSATSTAADDARRAVLLDVGQQVILPALQGLVPVSQSLASAVDAWRQDSNNMAAKAAAQAQWHATINAFQVAEVLQVGPAAISGADTPGGEARRNQMYTFPSPGRSDCNIDANAYAAVTVDDNTRVDAVGLSALEYLLFTASGANSVCPIAPPAGADVEQARADYAAQLAERLLVQATNLRDRWEPGAGDFLNQQFANAGNGSNVYGTPQDALNALTAALFYVEKLTKDNKIACPTGIGATGLSCSGNDVSRVEFALARASTVPLRNNVQTFRDVISGVNGGMGLQDLLIGVGRQDIATRLLQQLDATLDHLDNEIAPDFETEVEGISSAGDCTNASSNATGEPAACSLHGLLNQAMTTFRTEVVAALSLSTPSTAAGDND